MRIETYEKGVLISTGEIPDPVPPVITAVQARLALTAAGLRQAAEAAIAAGSQDVKDYWQFSTEIRRDNSLLASIATALGLTSAQVDALFVSAAQLGT
jgi:broad specificity phosphatase PhoE